MKDGLLARYDLTKPAGRTDWYQAYEKSAPPVRHLLLRLWGFEPVIDEHALIREAGEKDHSQAARVVLTELWQNGGLSGAGKQALLERFLAVRLEELPHPPEPPDRELRIVAEPHFPFPATIWVRYRSGFAVGPAGLRLSDSTSKCSLGLPAPIVLGTLGGFFPGQREARALLEVSESVPAGGKPGWSCRWELGPVRLRDAAGR